MESSAGWRKVALSSRDIMKGRGRQLQYGFERLFMDAKSPPDAALLISFGQMTNDFFFSPGAVRMLVMNDGAQSLEFMPEHDLAVPAIAS